MIEAYSHLVWLRLMSWVQALGVGAVMLVGVKTLTSYDWLILLGTWRGWSCYSWTHIKHCWRPFYGLVPYAMLSLSLMDFYLFEKFLLCSFDPCERVLWSYHYEKVWSEAWSRDPGHCQHCCEAKAGMCLLLMSELLLLLMLLWIVIVNHF